MGLFFYFCIKPLLFEKHIHQSLAPSNSPDLQPVASENSPHGQHFFSLATLKIEYLLFKIYNFCFLCL